MDQKVQTRKLNAKIMTGHQYLSLLPGTEQHTLWAAAQKGGKPIDDYRTFRLRIAQEFNDLSNFVKEKGEAAFEKRFDGQGNPILVVTPPTGSTSLVIRSHAFLEDQHDPASGVNFNGVGEVVVDSSTGQLSTIVTLAAVDSAVLATGTLLRLYIDSILAAGRAVITYLAQNIRSADTVELSDIELTETDLAEGVADTTTTTVDATAEATVTVASTASQVVTVAFVVIGVAVIALELLLKDFVHTLTLTNLTDLDLELETLDPHFIHEASSTQGKLVAKPATATLAAVLEAGELLNVTTAQYITTNKADLTSIKYRLRFKANDTWPNGFTFEFEVPFFKDNRSGGSFDIPDAGWKSNRTLHTDAETQVLVDSGADITGNYRAILTFNQLSTDEIGGGQYHSGLTIVDMDKYAGLLS